MFLNLMVSALLSSCLASSPQMTDFRTLDDLKAMDGFKKLLPKGKIAAIFKPEFVTADQAELPDEAWIIGVFDGKHAKAYSINLLNRHEIVNDFIGDKPIATTW